MLDFRFIADEKPMHARSLIAAGGIEYEEFVKAQELAIIEHHLDYYGKFHWSSQRVKHKRSLLIKTNELLVPNLAGMLKQAFAAGCGLAAFGD